MNKAQLLGRIDAAWRALTQSYGGLTESEMLEPGVTGAWSVRDIIAHVTWWEEEALSHLPAILQGRKPPRYSTTYGGIDAFNAQMAERKKHLSLVEVMREREETHRRLIDLIEQAPDDQITVETKWRHRLRLDTYGHYPKHAAAIRRWRGQRQAGQE